jgi:hypothetical protein
MIKNNKFTRFISQIKNLIIKKSDIKISENITSLNFKGSGVSTVVINPTNKSQVDITITGGSGGGDVTGPSSSITNDFSIFSDTSGKLLSDSGINITDITDINKYLNIIDSTGLIQGGELSIGSGSTKFNIAAGFGIIVDNYTDSENPTKTLIQWVDKIDEIDTLISLCDTSYVAINNLGTIILSQDPFDNIQRRSLISLGWIDHTGGVPGVNAILTEPVYNNAIQSQLNDFIESFGAFNVEGNIYTALTGLTIQRSAGKTFDGNANYEFEKRDPHVVSTNLEAPVNFYYYYRDPGPSDPYRWFNDSPVTTLIDPNQWDDGTGILKSVSGTNFTIQLISFYSPTLINDIQYGQAEYATLDEAKSKIREPVEINPYNSYDTFRCWLIIQKGCIDLTNPTQATFLPAGKLGMNDAGTGSIGGSGGEVNTASNIGTSGTGLYKQKIGVDLQFKNILANSSKILITEDIPNSTIKIDASISKTDISLGNVDNIQQMPLSYLDTDGTLTANSDTKVASQKATKTYADTKLSAGANSLYLTPANPTNLTNNAFRMFGLGSTIVITPLKSGKVQLIIKYMPGGTGTNGMNSYKIVYGTGVAPANGAAASGTIVGGTDSGGTTIAVAGTPPSIVRTIIVTGLTLNTAYWFDVQGAKNSGNSAVSMSGIECTLVELPY